MGTFLISIFIIFIIWRYYAKNSKPKNKETQTCDKLDTNYDTCDSCEEFERGEEISSLVVLSLEKIKKATMYFIGWSKFRVLWSPTRFLPTTVRRVTISEKIGINQNYLHKFLLKRIYLIRHSRYNLGYELRTVFTWVLYRSGSKCVCHVYQNLVRDFVRINIRF